MSKKKNKTRVKVGKLPQRETELCKPQTANVKGGAGNAGAGGGDVRSIRDLRQ
ncbi:MAG TPA: hypothetical protein VIK24_20150 [Pyrinomonadaceae bacterium]